MSELIYDTWNGEDFGHNGTTQKYGLIQSDGLDDIKHSGSVLAGGFDGEAFAPMFTEGRAWVNTIDLVATSAEAWQALRDDLAAATASHDEGPYVIHHRDDTWTIFARVTNRSIPRNSDTVEKFYGVASVAYAATDPVAYGPTTTVTFTGGSDSEVVTSTGWVDSYRWKWVVPGPVTNPRISSTLDSSAVVRYVGTIADGDNLVVDLRPRGCVPGYYAKIVADADLADYDQAGVGTAAYGALDGGPSGSARPPQWFPIVPGAQTISYAATSGTAGSTFTWRAGHA